MSGHCAVLAAMRDLDDIYEHMSEFCMECVDAQLGEAANSEELIFTEGPPTWIAARQARDAEAKAAAQEEQRRAAAAEKKRKALEEKNERNGVEKKINWASTEESKKAELIKFAGQKSDKHLEHEIKKLLRVTDVEAAQMRLELKREIALKRKGAEKEQEKVEVKTQIKEQKEEQKTNPNGPKELNKFQKRPWQPQIIHAIGIADERRSALSVEEQKRYASIIINFHAIDKSARFEQNKQDLKMYDDRLAEERVIVDGIVRERLAKENVSTKEMQKEIDYVLTRWQSRYLNDQRRFERVKQIEWSREAEQSPVPGVLKPTLERLLMAAPNPKLALPATMHDRLSVAYDSYRFDVRAKRGTTISNDTVLRTLCADNGCTFAMDATTAVHLMSRASEPRNYAYNVPVTVFDQFIGGGIVRQCFLEKPRPQSGISSRTLLQMVAKYRAKSTFTQKAEDAHAKPSSSKCTVATVSRSKETIGELTICEDEEEKEEGGEGKTGFSLIDDLLGSMASSILPSSSIMSTSTGGAAPAKASTTAHSYGLFTIPSYTKTNHAKVIIRHSPCARNAATGGTEYAVTAKVELAHDAGVTKETFEEMLWTSMKAIFKGAVNSATIHMHPYMKDALQITHQRAVPQANQHNEGFHPLLSTRTEHLSRLLAELAELPSGDYLLQVSMDDEMTLYKESPRGNEMFFNKSPRQIREPIKPIDNFTGIDERRLLHWQVMQGRAPLSLWPVDHHMFKKYEIAMEREGKEKTKEKKPQQQQHQQHKPKPWMKPKTEEDELERKRNNYLKKQLIKEKKKRMNPGGMQGGPPMKKSIIDVTERKGD